MSSENKDVVGNNDPSRVEEDMSSLNNANLIYLQRTVSSPATDTNTDMKRTTVKALIERYFYQLQRGCGNPKCSNSYCASSGKVAPMSPNETAAKALQLFSQEAKLCEFYNQLPQIARTNHDSPTSSHSMSLDALSKKDADALSSNDSSTAISGSSDSSTSSSSSTLSTNTNISSSTTEDSPLLNTLATTSGQHISQNTDMRESVSNPPSPSTPTIPPIHYLNEQIFDDLINESQRFNSYDHLCEVIKDVFGSVDKLSQSFMLPVYHNQLTTSTTATKLNEILSKSPENIKKEDLRTLEGENEKDEDCTCEVEESAETNSDEPMNTDEPIEDENAFQSNRNDTLVNLESLRRIKNKLFTLDKSEIRNALNHGISVLVETLKFRLVYDWEKVLHCLVILFDMASHSSNSYADMEYVDQNLPKLCDASRVLTPAAQARLARIWATHCSDQLHSLVQCCQQLITIQTMFDEEMAQENQEVISVTKVLKIAFYANILASELHTHKCLENLDIENETSPMNEEEEEDIFNYAQEPKTSDHKFTQDSLEKELGVSSLDCRAPLVPYDEFYNEAFSDVIQMDRDYMFYRNLLFDPNCSSFSYMLYSFILTPATKVVALYYDSRIRMFSERNMSLYAVGHFLYQNESSHRPDLKLKINRDNIISDALIGLEMVAMTNPKDLKKQLVVEFVGEQGIDEGGVSKEFFQLIVEEIFNPDFGMFIQQEDTNNVWFNPTSFENEAQFTLVGILLGLAIYNNIILAVNFPMIVYRKLMGGVGSFYDLKDWSPTLYSGLKSMLDYEELDMEDVFMQTFKIRYKNVFGEVVEHELKPGGSDIIVNQQNKQEFVDLYCDFLLNRSVDRQFKAFKRGFEMVTDESPLKLLFRPEEVELLVCGSRKFDFNELEKSTEYEGGYTKTTQIIQDFWCIVHLMPEECKRKLLEFTTGSDRVPVGGLSRLKLLITRNGPDTDRLPTSHTCFNVLLLPEYSSKEKLEERLLKAINYSKGFGML